MTYIENSRSSSLPSSVARRRAWNESVNEPRDSANRRTASNRPSRAAWRTPNYCESAIGRLRLIRPPRLRFRSSAAIL
jgi:hypothetical protein